MDRKRPDTRKGQPLIRVEGETQAMDNHQTPDYGPTDGSGDGSGSGTDQSTDSIDATAL